MQTDCGDEKTRPFEPGVASFFFFKGNEEILIGDAENLFQGYQLADADVMDAAFDLRIYAAAHVVPTELQLSSHLILRHVCGVAQSADIRAKGLVVPDGLHSATSSFVQIARNSLQFYLMIYEIYAKIAMIS